jgi:hypothetical protein
MENEQIKMSKDISSRWGLTCDAPPIVRDALAYWEGKLCGRRMPARRDFDPVLEVPRLLPWVILVDVLRDPLDFRYRVIGTGITARSRRDHTGLRLSELNRTGPDSVVWNDRRTVVETRAPKLTAPSYIGGDKTIQAVSGIHLPVSGDGETVDQIFTFVCYHTAAQRLIKDFQ